jgi:ATP-binding cassette subfamily A (ABC1) protein 3
VHYPASIHAYGGPIFYLCLQTCFLFWLLSWLEARHKGHLPFPIPFRNKTTPAADEEGEINKMTEKEVLDEVKRVESSEDDLLRVLAVTKTFGKTRAVDNVSFGISGGEILVLLGPNGAGKSTIINMIRGELSPDNGRIILQGIDVEKQTQVGQRYIGCMFPLSRSRTICLDLG